VSIPVEDVLVVSTVHFPNIRHYFPALDSSPHLAFDALEPVVVGQPMVLPIHEPEAVLLVVSLSSFFCDIYSNNTRG